jgi:hypothetical protein
MTQINTVELQDFDSEVRVTAHWHFGTTFHKQNVFVCFEYLQ